MGCNLILFSKTALLITSLSCSIDFDAWYKGDPKIFQKAVVYFYLEV